MVGQTFNKYKVAGNIAYIYIEGKYKSTITIDSSDLEKIKHLRWYNGKLNYPYAKQKGKFIKLHRFIMDYNGKLTVDHINRNTLDCRKDNLRIADMSTQNKNRETPWNVKKRRTKTIINGVEYKSITEASKATGIPRTTLNDMKLKRYSKTKKYTNYRISFEEVVCK